MPPKPNKQRLFPLISIPYLHLNIASLIFLFKKKKFPLHSFDQTHPKAMQNSFGQLTHDKTTVISVENGVFCLKKQKELLTSVGTMNSNNKICFTKH